MSKNKKVTVGYWYSLGWHSVLCQGGADAIEEIRYADRIAWSGTVNSNETIYINRADLLGGEKREGGVQGFVDVMFGGPTQGVNQYLAYHCNVPISSTLSEDFSFSGGWAGWANVILAGEENEYLLENSGRPVPAYRGVVSLVFRDFTYAAMNPYMKDLSVRVRRLPRTLNTTTFSINIGGVSHANPAHIIYEVLTNRVWGMGFSVDDVDVASFTAAASTLHAENFGLSLAWTDEGTADDFINLIKAHINAVMYPAPDTGRYTIKLLRDDYDVSSAFVASPDNIVNLRSFQRASPTDLVNEVTVEYRDITHDKMVKITVQNLAGIQSSGRVVRKVISMPGICHGELAARVAQRELMTLSSPLAKVVVDLNMQAWNLRPGDVFVLQWPKLGIQGIVMRALEVEYQDIRAGTVTVMAIEDVFGIPDVSFSVAPSPDWLPPISGLTDLSAYLITELPYYVLVQSNGEDFTGYLADNRNYLGILAGRGSSIWQNFTAYEFISPNFVELSSASFSPWVLVSADVPKTASNTTIYYDAFFDDYQIQVGDLGVINNEWVQVYAIDREMRSVSVVRAILDTVPAAHAQGSRLWIYGEAILEDYSTERFAAETVQLRLVGETPSESFPVASATTRTYNVVGRQQRPYPPGRVRYADQVLPASLTLGQMLTVSWAHRDRVQQTAGVIGQDATSIGPEEYGTGSTRERTAYSVSIHNASTGASLLAHPDTHHTSVAIPRYEIARAAGLISFPSSGLIGPSALGMSSVFPSGATVVRTGLFDGSGVTRSEVDFVRGPSMTGRRYFEVDCHVGTFYVCLGYTTDPEFPLPADRQPWDYPFNFVKAITMGVSQGEKLRVCVDTINARIWFARGVGTPEFVAGNIPGESGGVALATLATGLPGEPTQAQLNVTQNYDPGDSLTVLLGPISIGSCATLNTGNIPTSSSSPAGFSWFSGGTPPSTSYSIPGSVEVRVASRIRRGSTMYSSWQYHSHTVNLT